MVASAVASFRLPSAAFDSGLLENDFPSHVSPLLQHQESQKHTSVGQRHQSNQLGGGSSDYQSHMFLWGKEAQHVFLPNFRGVVEVAPAERSVQLVHLVLQ